MKPIALKDATELGQIVKGTNAGSEYKVVAISNRLRVAYRTSTMKDGTAVLSLRAEWPAPSPEDAMDLDVDLSGLVAVGFTVHGNYASMHLNLANHPGFKIKALLEQTLVPFAMIGKKKE
jgi:hypothetical protein